MPRQIRIPRARRRGMGRRPSTRLPRRVRAAGSLRQEASTRLRPFRQASAVAVAATGLLLLFVAPDDVGRAQPTDAAAAETLAQAQPGPDTGAASAHEPLAAEEITSDSAVKESAAEATGALRGLWRGFVGNLPKYAIALGILALAWVLVRVLRGVLRRVLARWERANASAALAGVVIWLIAAGVALSVLLGDIRALAGSLGLVGLALSWALQTPIESFTGWLLNSFKGYYRVGDRVAVGEVFGDVYRIDFLNTTLWEYGGLDRPPGWVHAEQPTGRLITFPNSAVLSGSVVNYTRDFPFVWDELEVAVANESDVGYAMQVLEAVARSLLGDYMAAPARRYREILQREGLDAAASDEPQVYASMSDWGVNLTIRYLVGAREKRGWKSRLTVEVLRALNDPAHAGRIVGVYPRQQIQLVRADGTAVDPQQAGDG